MELLSHMSHTQFLFPAAAVAVVLVCAALVFIFGFQSSEQPQFDKLPLVVDDRKSASKKRKTKDKKSSPNRTANEDGKTKSESTKKSPVKEKVKEVEKPKPKVETKVVKKDVPIETKKGKKTKSAGEAEKPVDFDDGVWEEVPKKSEKKKVKSPDEKDKKESPIKKNKKKAKDADLEAARPAEVAETAKNVSEPETIRIVSAVGPEVDEDAARALQAQVEEFQRVLKEAERREQAALGSAEEEEEEGAEVEELIEVKDLRSNKKMENKEKQIKKKATEAAAVSKGAPKPEPVEKESSGSSEKQDDKQNVPVFDELGDTWTDAKIKKSKKKARKEN